jgi:hypothetical protein
MSIDVNQMKLLGPIIKQCLNNQPFMFVFIGVEKKNDDFRRILHRSISKWESTRSTICVEKRQQELVDIIRKKRKYVKQNHGFWYEGGKTEAATRSSSSGSTTQVLPCKSQEDDY